MPKLMMFTGPMKIKGPPTLGMQTDVTVFPPEPNLSTDRFVEALRMHPLVRFRLGPRGKGPLLRELQQGFETATEAVAQAGGGSRIAGGAVVG